MSTIVTRLGKGTALTWQEADANFTNLNLDKVEESELASSTGSSMIGHLPNGTGAVTTTVQNKLRETVSVRDFGAVGDGLTDDTAAIAAARNYVLATGRNVLVPPGTYLTDPFSINAQVYGLQGSFVGTDRERCVFKRRTAGADAFVTVGSPTGTVFQAGYHVSNLKFDGGSTSNGDTFVGYDLVRSSFDNCTFTGGAVACHLYGGISLTFKDCLFESAQIGFRAEKFSSLAGGGWPNLIKIRGGEVVDNTNGGIYFDDGRMLIVEGADIEGNGTTLGVSLGGIYVGQNIGTEVSVTDVISIGLIVRDCWFEGNRGVADIDLASGQNTVTDSNFFSNSTMVTNDIRVSAGKYVLRNLNMSFAKTANILENSGVVIGNTIDTVEAPNISFDSAKTAVLTGGYIYMQNGRVPIVAGLLKPLVQIGIDSSGVNPTITFPTAFKPGTTPTIFCQVINNDTDTLNSPETYSISRTGFTVRKKNFNGTVVTTLNYTVSWVAIGEAP